MPLAAGTRLGSYEILSAIGAGGMGEVFRARDAKLHRDVALKILPEAFVSDPDRLARFTREAQTLASLNHPNIAHIYGLDRQDGREGQDGTMRAATVFIVMELVDGEDLSALIARGPMPLADVLAIARQIADALEAAHERGIVHRDLKPANIKVRADGTVKVLDFGLAKAVEGAGRAGGAGGEELASSPTITSPAMTLQGVILGTAAYMAPEQARGKAVDKRADIWAFGVVLYEMLTGRRLFEAEDMSETLAAVLTRDVGMTTLPAAIPARLRALLRDCLIRDPRQRLRDVGDARIALAQIIAGAPDDIPAAASVTAADPPWRRVLPWAVVGALATLLLLLLALWAPWRANTPVDRPLARLDVDLGADVSLPAPARGGINLAISPDGARLAYASGTPTKLFTRRLDQPNATELPGTQRASRVFFSPDGQWVGFVSGGKVNKIAVEGGAVVPLGNVVNFAGASWGEDGSIIAGDTSKGLVRIPAGGGPPETVAGLGNGERALALPQLLPGGKAILFAADPALGVDKITIEVLTLADRRRKVVVRGGQSPRYLPTSNRAGHLVYINKGTLFAIPFDLNTLETRGTAVPVLNDVAYNPLVGSGEFDVSRTGTLVYRRSSGGASATMTVQWVDAAGRKQPLRAKPDAYQNPRLSPDGKRVALTVTAGPGTDVWVYDPQRDTITRLTFGGGFYLSPTWSPDGQYVVFASFGMGLFQARADGAGQPQALTETKANQTPSSFTPDGKRLTYFETAGNTQIWTMPLEDQGGRLKAGKPEPFLKSNSIDASPAFSPDGRWLAYQSNESGTNEVYVRAFPPSSGQGGKWQISNNGGTVPRWSRSGHELMYQSGDQILAVSYTVNGGTFVAEKPRVWIPKLGAAAAIPNAAVWDLAPDGKRVAVLTPMESAEAPKPEHEVVFLLNFFDELRRRLPVGK